MSGSGLPIVVCNFSEAYTLRGTLGIIRQLCPEALFTFRKDGIFLSRINDGNDVLVELEIWSSELDMYEMNAYTEDGEEVDQFDVGFSLSEIMKAIKSIGKKDGVRLYMMPGDSRLYVQLISSSRKGTETAPINVVPTIKVVREEHVSFSYSREEDDPNIRISSTDFAKSCTNMTTMKVSYVTATGFPTGVLFKGFADKNSIVRVEPFGDVNPQQEPDVISDDLAKMLDDIRIRSNRSGPIPSLPATATCPVTPLVSKRLKINVRKQEDLCLVRMKGSLIKILSKINTICPGGLVKIYIEPGLPLKLVSGVGSYGRCTFYIRDNTC